MAPAVSHASKNRSSILLVRLVLCTLSEASPAHDLEQHRPRPFLIWHLSLNMTLPQMTHDSSTRFMRFGDGRDLLMQTREQNVAWREELTNERPQVAQRSSRPR